MKTIKHTMIAMMSLAGLATMGTGCAERDTEPTDDVQPLPAPMASADRDGVHLDIYQLSPGDLAVVATGDLPEGLDGKTPVEIYEAVAAQAAPAILRDSQARIAAKRALLTDDVEGSTGADDPPDRSSIANLTATDFQTAWCSPASADFDYCWLNRTNNYSMTVYNIDWIHSHVNAYSGTLTHRMLYRAFAGSWNLINADTTTGSSYVSTFSETANGDYEVELTNATGDGYHLAIHGDF